MIEVDYLRIFSTSVVLNWLTISADFNILSPAEAMVLPTLQGRVIDFKEVYAFSTGIGCWSV